MPAYFSVSFFFRKDCITDTSVHDFYESLIKCGLSFQSGYYGFENDTLQEITAWNQMKLNDNFQIGYTEHYSHDYRQVQFSFHDFSEVRVFILNDRESDSFSFELIIPEGDFRLYKELNGQYEVVYLHDRMLLIKKLISEMWERNPLQMIQTEWELDGPTIFEDLMRGLEPCIEPYAVVPKEIVRSSWSCECYEIGRDGMMLVKDHNW